MPNTLAQASLQSLLRIALNGGKAIPIAVGAPVNAPANTVFTCFQPIGTTAGKLIASEGASITADGTSGGAAVDLYATREYRGQFSSIELTSGFGIAYYAA